MGFYSYALFLGMGAAVSHIPDQGKFLVVVASHVGYSPVMNSVSRLYFWIFYFLMIIFHYSWVR